MIYSALFWQSNEYLPCTEHKDGQWKSGLCCINCLRWLCGLMVLVPSFQTGLCRICSNWHESSWPQPLCAMKVEVMNLLQSIFNSTYIRYKKANIIWCKNVVYISQCIQAWTMAVKTWYYKWKILLVTVSTRSFVYIALTVPFFYANSFVLLHLCDWSLQQLPAFSSPIGSLYPYH